jgi:DNA-binding IclR family transcriptional regulator
LGKAVLAHFDASELEAHLPEVLTPVTSSTLTSRADLHKDLQLTRERGYSVDDEENTVGLRCFGVALPIRAGLTDALSCSVPIERLTADREREIITALKSTADITLQIVRGLRGLVS